MWDVEDEETTQPEAPPAEEVAAPAEAAPEEAPVPAPETVKGTDVKLIFRHWVRPKFLQYNYMYDYRRNYYDDVINYMDRRNQGEAVEQPRPQEWGERALRTYLTRFGSSRGSGRDAALLRHISTGARFHRYHTKSLISRKYSTLGFNIVSI